jgi:hypothetical protein
MIKLFVAAFTLLVGLVTALPIMAADINKVELNLIADKALETTYSLEKLSAYENDLNRKRSRVLSYEAGGFLGGMNNALRKEKDLINQDNRGLARSERAKAIASARQAKVYFKHFDDYNVGYNNLLKVSQDVLSDARCVIKTADIKMSQICNKAAEIKKKIVAEFTETKNSDQYKALSNPVNRKSVDTLIKEGDAAAPKPAPKPSTPTPSAKPPARSTSGLDADKATPPAAVAPQAARPTAPVAAAPQARPAATAATGQCKWNINPKVYFSETCSSSRFCMGYVTCGTQTVRRVICPLQANYSCAQTADDCLAKTKQKAVKFLTYAAATPVGK